MTQQEWIVSGDTGISSETMWAALNGLDMTDKRKNSYRPSYDVPYDPADFGRCYRYYQKCSLTKDDLQTIKSKIKWWAPFIDAWDQICELYDAEKDNGRMPKTYELIQKCENESRILDGWVQTSPTSWKREA